MTNLSTANLIARGRTLNDQIDTATAELKQIETILRSRARQCHTSRFPMAPAKAAAPPSAMMIRP